MMEIRRAEIKDVNTLVEFRKQQLIDEGDVPSVNIDKELRDYFTSAFSEGRSIIWIATDQGVPVATGGLYFFQFPPGYGNPTGERAYVHSMYTKEQYRGKGIASRILKAMIVEVKKRGSKILFLQASKDGRPVYEKIGFTQSEDVMVMRFPNVIN